MNFPVSRFLIAGNDTRKVNMRGLFLISSFVPLVSQWTKLKRPVCIFPLFSHRFGKTFSGVSLNCQCFSAQLQEHQLSFCFSFSTACLAREMRPMRLHHRSPAACSHITTSESTGQIQANLRASGGPTAIQLFHTLWGSSGGCYCSIRERLLS